MTTWLYVVLTFQLLLVASVDLKQKKISNLWSVFNVIFAAILWPLGHLGAWSFQVLLFPVALIVTGFFLFVFKIMGAGDSKYLAALFFCMPVSLHFIYFEKLLLSTMLVGSILLLLKILRDPGTFKSYFLSQHWKGIMGLVKSHFSYAPVMLLAWLLLGVELWF